MSKPVVKPADARAWLDAHVNLETAAGSGPQRRRERPTLDRIRSLMELLGSPQLEYPAIHITGTNGKTSTARIAAALLASTGLVVGLYTSPNLERVNERIARDGELIDDAELDEILAHLATIEPFLPDVPSYFDLLTATALRWFADVAVDVAVVEVGMGGTWDATNVVRADVAVVTNVSIDHVEYLGPTREGIATEKAGIIDPGATLVLGETDPELRPLFGARHPGRVLDRDVDFGVSSDRVAHGGRYVDLFTPYARDREVFLPLHGAYQADNAAAGLAAAETFLERAVDHEVVVDAFAGVRSPGRLEVVRHRPLVLLDGAHNVAGARALRTALADEFPPAPVTLVVGLLREKDPREMLDALGAVDATRLVCCAPPSPRALDPSEVARAALELGLDPARIEVLESVAEALETASANTAPDGEIVVAGSLYTVGAARAVLVME